jgi:hypothetical protein
MKFSYRQFITFYQRYERKMMVYSKIGDFLFNKKLNKKPSISTTINDKNHNTTMDLINFILLINYILFEIDRKYL